MPTDFTFAYGSNMNRSDLRSWLERNGDDSSMIVGYRPAILEGYDFVWNYYSSSRAGGAANLEPKSGGAVLGVLIEFEEPLLKAFDRKEGHPVFYSRGDNRISVICSEDNQSIPAWIYIAGPNKGARHDIWPTRAYKKIIVDAAVENGFPQDYVQRLESWQTQG